jgi:hypothetical protein
MAKNPNGLLKPSLNVFLTHKFKMGLKITTLKLFSKFFFIYLIQKWVLRYFPTVSPRISQNFRDSSQ